MKCERPGEDIRQHNSLIRLSPEKQQFLIFLINPLQVLTESEFICAHKAQQLMNAYLTPQSLSKAKQKHLP